MIDYDRTMTRHVPLADDCEEDALTRRKSLYRWRAGARKWSKRRFNKRERRYLNTSVTDGW